jgi:hypothetical protein
MQGLSLKRHARAEWDWEVAASKYDYRQDLVRTPTVLAAVGPAASPTWPAAAGRRWR